MFGVQTHTDERRDVDLAHEHTQHATNVAASLRTLLRLLSKLLHMGAVKESRLLHPSDVLAVGNPIRVDGGHLRQVGAELVESNPIRNNLRQQVTGNLWSNHAPIVLRVLFRHHNWGRVHS